ncbi:MAG: cupin [Candidatus Calescibacterium sp.]|nr:cupin [Candidatus Calescibacterium sp.]
MSALIIFDEQGRILEKIKEHNKIAEKLKSIGIRFEKWQTEKELPWSADQNEVIQTYKNDIDRINSEFGFKSIDVVSLTPDNPKKVELRNMFLSEHIHTDFEVRFFVDGSGTFYLHPDDKVYVVLCEKGDFISVPANTKHWFDMGNEPFFKAIRFFSTPDGWVANFTGSDISQKIPSHDEIVKMTKEDTTEIKEHTKKTKINKAKSVKKSETKKAKSAKKSIKNRKMKNSLKQEKTKRKIQIKQKTKIKKSKKKK